MAEATSPRGPLAGLTVLDFTRVLSGPFATMALADLGADVIKVEPPDGDDTRGWGPPFIGEESTYFMSVNRNKRSVVLDLKNPDDLNRARSLARSSDIVVENFRPGVADRLGIGFARLSQDDPRLVYASISGYGKDSTESSKPGYDPIVQARSGLMSITGSSDGAPARVGIAIADISASMWLTIGILAALRSRDQTGRGQHVDVALYDAQVSWLTNVAGSWFAEGADAQRYGSEHPSIVPSATYRAADADLMIAVGNDRMWFRLTEALGSQALREDARFITNAGRVEHRDELRAALQAILQRRPVDAWIQDLEDHDVPCARVNTIGEALSDPLLRERDMIVSQEHPTVGTVRSVGCPVRFSEDAVAYRLPPPLLGEHTAQVLHSSTRDAMAGSPAVEDAARRSQS